MIETRAADRGDLDAIVELWQRDGGPTRHAGGHAQAEALWARDPQALIVAGDDDGIVGAVIAGWDGWRLHVYRLVVARSARRQGVARRLMAGVDDRARAVGAARIDAMVDPDNAAAIAFWLSLGFEPDRDARWSRLAAPSPNA